MSTWTAERARMAAPESTSGLFSRMYGRALKRAWDEHEDDETPLLKYVEESDGSYLLVGLTIPRRTDYHYRRKGRWVTKTVLCERKASDVQ